MEKRKRGERKCVVRRKKVGGFYWSENLILKFPHYLLAERIRGKTNQIIITPSSIELDKEDWDGVKFIIRW
jgi:hypothetical protein